jgi:hypothetical protein
MDRVIVTSAFLAQKSTPELTEKHQGLLRFQKKPGQFRDSVFRAGDQFL